MTTTAQLWHLARKDLTQFRWWFAAYLVAVASSTAVALERALATDSSWPAIVAPLSWILGGLLAAQLVQSDAPANARAYWAGIPIDSRVLLLAKSVIVTTLLCFPPLLGQLLAIEHYGVPTTRAIPMIMASGSVYGAWLLLAMLVASVTTRLTGFAGVLIGVPVLFAFFGIMVAGSSWRVLTAHVPAVAIGLVTVLTAASMLLLVYLRRRAGRGLLCAGALLVASGLLAVTAPAGRATAAPLPPTRVTAITMQIAPVDWQTILTNEEQSLDFDVTGMTPGYRYAFLVDSAAATWSMQGSEPWTTSVFHGQSPIIFGGNTQSQLVGSLFISARPTSRDGKPTGAVRSLRVSGEVQTLASRALARFPATGRARVSDGDVALDVDGIHAVRSGAAISFLAGSSIFEPSRRLSPESRYTLQLVWSSRADTLQVPLNSTSKVEQLLVLPGARLNRVTIRHPGNRSTLFDRLPASLDGAELELLGWSSIARYPVTMERVVR